MIVLSRIDNRLIHGQVVEAWVPHLHVARMVVADDVAASDALMKAAMAMAVPPDVEVVMERIDRLDFAALAQDSVRTLLLFRSIPSAVAAREHGLPDGLLNVGNVHSTQGAVALSRSVYVSAEERAQLVSLKDHGMTVVLQSVPSDAPTPLA